MGLLMIPCSSSSRKFSSFSGEDSMHSCFVNYVFNDNQSRKGFAIPVSAGGSTAITSSLVMIPFASFWKSIELIQILMAAVLESIKPH